MGRPGARPARVEERWVSRLGHVVQSTSHGGVTFSYCALMLSGGTGVNGLWVDFGVLVAIFAVLIILCARV